MNMPLDQARLRQLAPFALAVIILAAGWALLVRPQAAEKQQAERQLASLRPRLEGVRRAMMEPPPPVLAVDPAGAFTREVTAGDPGRILEELSRLAPRARYRNLSIDATGEQVSVRGGGGPQVAGAVAPDPRFALFNAPLTYLPVTMSFDADYASVGELLWRLRDVGTIVEIRNVDIKPAAAAAGGETAPAGLAPATGGQPGDASGASAGDLHVSLMLFAYARAADVAEAAR